MGLYLEEFEINKTHRTRGRTMGEGDVALFAGLVGDTIRCMSTKNSPRRASSAAASRMVPLVLSTAIGLMSQLNWIDGTALGLLGIAWEFQAPVKLGDTVSAKVTPLKARPSKTPGRGIRKSASKCSIRMTLSFRSDRSPC